LERELRSHDPHPHSQEVISPPGKQRLGRDSSDSDNDFHNGGGEHPLPFPSAAAVTSGFRTTAVQPSEAHNLRRQAIDNGAEEADIDEDQQHPGLSDENLPPGVSGSLSEGRRVRNPDSLSDDEEMILASETVHQAESAAAGNAAIHNHFHHFSHSHPLDESGADLSDLSAHRA
jgi:hypothetical protein